ncbi:MAG: protein kinase [Candidatus Acidiferrales bacterium]
MTILPGTRLGPYEILSPIGAGGMGEVYRARDTRLDRIVAIKVLPDAFAHDPERLSRFQREAKMLAALNHPNIATIYGMEQSGGTSYLVMELVPGDTLADRIKRDGALPVEEALAIAKQIAEALEAAHEKGIIHRDLKPANVKVTPEGVVKVLDFGLAKAFEGDASAESIANSPTLSMAATMQGAILGTAAYMSPEQARGKSVDKRTDIWAFGVVLYEMLTGEELFAGETVSDTLAAVLRHEPDWRKIPARLQPLLRSCLERNAKKRLRDIGDAGLLIQETPGEPAELHSLASSPRWLWAVTAAACIVAAGLAVIHFREKQAPPPETIRFQIRLPDKVVFTRSAHLSLSPDGHHVAFPAVGADGHTGIWVQDLDAQEARELPGTDPTIDTPPLFWSPDSHFIAFDSGSKIRKVGVMGEPPQDICDRPSAKYPPIGGSWNREGILIFGTSGSGLWKVPAAGGSPVPLTVLDASRHEREHELPVFLPDGRHFLYFRNSTAPEFTGAYVGSLEDLPEHQSEKRVLASGFGASFVPSDNGDFARLLFMANGNLMVQTFDLGKLDVIGEPSPVAERIDTAYETAHFSANPNVLVYKEKSPDVGFQLTWFDDQGKTIGHVGDPAPYITTIRVSPDGTRVAFSKGVNADSDHDLWLADLKRGTTTRFTFGPGKNEYPVWSPDGSEIVFSSNRDGIYNLYRKPADGSKAEQLLLGSNEDKRAFSWSRDGRFLAYGALRSSGPEQGSALPMHGDSTPIPLSGPGSTSARFEFSPDGRWIAYNSNETGVSEVYVREFTGTAESAATGGKWMISKDGGLFPHWRADGKEIVYTTADQSTLMTVSVDTSHSFQAGTPQMLFRMPVDRGGTNVVAPTADLKKFLMGVPVEQKAAQSFTVILNWASALKK